VGNVWNTGHQRAVEFGLVIDRTKTVTSAREGNPTRSLDLRTDDMHLFEKAKSSGLPH
jgi:hypothetical protein